MFEKLLTIKGKIFLLVTIPSLIFLLEHIYISSMQKEELYTSKKETIMEIVNLTQNTINEFKKLSDSCKLTKKEAQEKAKEFLKGMIYQGVIIMYLYMIIMVFV